MFVLSWVVVGYKRNVDIEALLNSIINGIYRGIYNSTSPFILSTFTSRPQTETEGKNETVVGAQSLLAPRTHYQWIYQRVRGWLGEGGGY